MTSTKSVKPEPSPVLVAEVRKLLASSLSSEARAGLRLAQQEFAALWGVVEDECIDMIGNLAEVRDRIGEDGDDWENEHILAPSSCNPVERVRESMVASMSSSKPAARPEMIAPTPGKPASGLDGRILACFERHGGTTTTAIIAVEVYGEDSPRRRANAACCLSNMKRKHPVHPLGGGQWRLGTAPGGADVPTPEPPPAASSAPASVQRPIVAVLDDADPKWKRALDLLRQHGPCSLRTVAEQVYGSDTNSNRMRAVALLRGLMHGSTPVDEVEPGVWALRGAPKPSPPAEVPPAMSVAAPAAPRRAVSAPVKPTPPPASAAAPRPAPEPVVRCKCLVNGKPCGHPCREHERQAHLRDAHNIDPTARAMRLWFATPDTTAVVAPA